MTQIKKVLPILVFLFIGKGIGSELSEEDLEEEQRFTLSKDELQAITNALFKTATHPCPSIDLSVISNIKNFIVGLIMLGAPKLTKQNEEFSENYGKFVGCLERQALSNPNAQTGVQRLKEINIRSRRDLHGLTIEQAMELEEDNEIFDAVSQEEPAARTSFQRFLNLLSSIAGHDCPLGKRPSSKFVNSAVKEIMHWLSIKPDLMKKAEEKYFHRLNILGDLQKCNKTLEKKREKISRTRSYAA